MKSIFSFIKKNRNIILLTLSFIFLTMLILGMTYAYFDLKTGGETESTMNVGGAEISATYAYSNSINITDVLPGNGIIASKDITLTYKNTSSEEYKVYLKAVIDYNTFTNEENGGVLKYEIKSGNDTIQSQTTFPTITSGKAILTELTIPANSNGTLKYTINFYFPESDKLQNPDGQLILNAFLSVESDDSSEYSKTLLKQVDLMYQYESETNGLEKDDTTDENIRYVGASPKNYLTFNDETWRIIGIFNVYNVDTKKTEKLVKIIRNDSLGIYSWDATGNNNYGINDWSEADLMKELNGDYLDTNLTANKTNWYNSYFVTDAPVFRQTGVFDYTKVIKTKYQQMISTSIWNLGGNTYNDPITPPYVLSTKVQYEAERGTVTYQNSRATTWTGKIGLMYASDYGYASTDTECQTNLRAGYTYTNNTWDYTKPKCKNNNWLFNNEHQWTLSPYSSQESWVFGVWADGGVSNEASNNNLGVRPTLYLKSDVVISGGTGTESNPYKLLVEEEEKTPTPTTFANDSWETISKVVKSGNTTAYPVGSEKEVEIGGTSYTVRVANNTTPSECNSENFSQTACGFVVEFTEVIAKRNINPSKSGTQFKYGWNVDGWPASDMRNNYTNSEFFNSLPEDLRKVIINTKVVSGHGSTSGETNFVSTDKIYLLSPHEVYEDGTSNKVSTSDTAYSQTRQLDYYKSKGVTTTNYASAAKKYGTETSRWWLRSARKDTNVYFISVTEDGKWGSNGASGNYGFSPAFRIG